MLTSTDLSILQRPFEASQHKFIQGRAYIAEEAILTRIEEIDPDWSFRKLDTTQRDKQIISTFAMTIKGNTKDGVGMGMIEMSKPFTDKQTGEMKEPREINEAEKSAATDAMRRAARLFGIGRYLLSLPKDSSGKPTVTTNGQLETWIKQRFANTPKPAQPPASVPTAALQAASVQNAPDAPISIATVQNEQIPEGAPNGATSPSSVSNAGKSITDQISIAWKPGDVHEFDVVSVTTKARDPVDTRKGYSYALETTNGTIIWAFNRDYFREVWKLNVSGWDANGFKLNFHAPIPAWAICCASSDVNKPNYWKLDEADERERMERGKVTIAG